MKACIPCIWGKKLPKICPTSITLENERERNDVLVSLVGNPKRDVKHIDHITKLVSKVLNVSVCMADFIYYDKAYLISRYNWDFVEIPRYISFCGWSLLPLNSEPLIIEDTLQDARFRENQFVQRLPCLRFYVGVPIVVMNGIRLGNLCIMDVIPNLISAAEISFMCNCATLISNNILYEKFKETACHKPQNTIVCDITTWEILYVNQSCIDFDIGLAVGDKMLDVYKETVTQITTQKTFDEMFEMVCMKGNGNLVFLKFWKCSLRRYPHYISVMPRRTPDILNTIYFAEISNYPTLVYMNVNIPVQKQVIDLKLNDLLGSGRNGNTYNGVYKDKKVVIKVLNNITEFIDKQHIDKLLNLQNNNIIKIYYCINGTANILHVATDLCSNDTLQANLERGFFRKSFYSGSVDILKVYEFALQISRGMKYLHDHDIIHGNLTSRNIMLEKDIVKITDYALTISIQKKLLLNSVDDIVYKPLEYFTDGHMNSYVDVFAFGVIMYELYTNKRPWVGTYPVTILKKRQNGEQLKFPQHTPTLYRDLSMICMHNEPFKRPNFTHIVSCLEVMLENVPKVSFSSPVYNSDDFH